MTPKIRLVHLKTRTVDWHAVDAISWDKVWTISHVWDGGEEIKKKIQVPPIPLTGVSWRSESFSSENRFNAIFEKTRQIVEPRRAEYVWMDAACIDQGREDDKAEQIPFMGTIYSKSAGCVAFGTLTPDDRFVEIASTYDNGRKAWVCNWFERVWTFQELSLPKILLFVSGEHVLTRDELYLSMLMMSPYFTSCHPSPPSHDHDPTLSIHDVLNSLSPLSRTNTQRSLMQTAKRGCRIGHIPDKIYGITGILARPFSGLKVDYKISLEQVVLNLMLLMPPNDILDMLTFNTLPPADNIHDTLHWSGMVMLDKPTEHPSYETDIHHPTDARVIASGAPCTTEVYNVPLWRVVVTKPEDTDAELAGACDPTWPSIVDFSRYAKLTDDFSKVERSADYVDAIGRAERSLAANWESLHPLLKNVDSAVGDGKFLFTSQDLLSRAKRFGGIPPNRLGDPSLFCQEVAVLVCRSKANKLFHYGIVVTPNEDGSWHKVCTASFSDGCVVADSRTRVESKIVIGK